jgi:hypothetical protein
MNESIHCSVDVAVDVGVDVIRSDKVRYGDGHGDEVGRREGRVSSGDDIRYQEECW